MNKRQLIDKLFNEGKKAGLKDMEVYIQGGKRFDIRVFEGEIDNYNISKEEGLSFRGIYHGKMGYSYTERIDESSIKMLVQEAIQNAKVIDSEDEEKIFEGSEEYKEVNSYNEELDKTDAKEKIDFIKRLEKEAFNIDKRVKSVSHCIFGEECINTLMVNTKGLDLENESNITYTYINVMVKEGNDVKTGGKYTITNDFSKFDYKALAEEAVNEAISMLGADTTKSDNYKVILRNDVAANILEAFVPIFCAENVQKGLSRLKGKLNSKIANEIITVIDDPFMEGGIASCSFDGEGVATKYKRVIENGVLTTFLHNTKTAKKDGVESTGNAYKASYKSPISISPTNMYIEKGDVNLEDMIKAMDNGLLIINVEGLHSGLNTVSGDFSLSAYGYEIEGGKIKRPVNQITIAGNFYEMLNNIIMVGDDLKFALPGGLGYIGSPSLLIKELSVSGE